MGLKDCSCPLLFLAGGPFSLLLARLQLLRCFYHPRDLLLPSISHPHPGTRERGKKHWVLDFSEEEVCLKFFLLLYFILILIDCLADMVKKKPNAKPNLAEEGIDDKSDHPTRKRGRPRKIIAEEDLFEEAEAGEEEEEEEDTVKKNKGRTVMAEQQKKQHDDNELELPPSSSDHPVPINIVEVKPKTRGRRKGQPRKSF